MSDPTPVPFVPSRAGDVALRWMLFALLALFALFYLMPLFVMITTSLPAVSS